MLLSNTSMKNCGGGERRGEGGGGDDKSFQSTS